MSTLRRILGYLVTHPSARGNPLAPVARFVGWQLRKRLWPRPATFSVFDGMKLLCYPDSRSASAVIYLGLPDWDEMNLLLRVLAPGDGFIDVGANVGVYSVLAASRIGRQAPILAVEADPDNAPRLRENLALNGLDGATVAEVAVGAEEGVLRFAAGGDAISAVASDDAGPGIEVPVRCLDALISEPDAYTVGKMDIEGFEFQAMSGAEELLATGHPRLWLLETNDTCGRYGQTRADLQELLAKYGYLLYQAQQDGRRLVPVPEGGPFPQDSFALRDVEWLRERAPEIEVLT